MPRRFAKIAARVKRMWSPRKREEETACELAWLKELREKNDERRQDAQRALGRSFDKIKSPDFDERIRELTLAFGGRK